MTQNDNNFLYSYGPHTKADSIKMELLVSLSSFDIAICEEKILGQHIKINHLATPYKAAVLYAVKTTIAFRTQVLASNNDSDLIALQQKFMVLKSHIEFEMSLAYQKTQELIVYLQSMVNLSHIKNQLKNLKNKTNNYNAQIAYYSTHHLIMTAILINRFLYRFSAFVYSF